MDPTVECNFEETALGGLVFIAIYVGFPALAIRAACKKEKFQTVTFVDPSNCKYFKATSMNVTYFLIKTSKNKKEGCQKCKMCKEKKEISCRYYYHSYYHPTAILEKNANTPCYTNCNQCENRRTFHWLFHKYHLAYAVSYFPITILK